MIPHGELPQLHSPPLQSPPMSDLAVKRFYQLLDADTVSTNDSGYSGNIAVSAAAEEFRVSTAQLWRWIGERRGLAPPRVVGVDGGHC